MCIHMAAEKLPTGVRREQIVQAALAVVAGEGLARLNVARVARRVGLTPSALYRHFPSKDAILDAVLESVRERLLANARAARDEGGPAIRQLRSLLASHLELVLDQPGLPRLLFSEQVYAGAPRRRVQMYRLVQAYMDRVADIVRVGQRSGQIRKRLDPAAVALLFVGLVQPAAILAHAGGAAFDARRQVAKTWEMFAAAIATA